MADGAYDLFYVIHLFFMPCLSLGGGPWLRFGAFWGARQVSGVFVGILQILLEHMLTAFALGNRQMKYYSKLAPTFGRAGNRELI